ncbi:MAG: hypothetical protein Phog2KO_15540 [Phototrophicaceae bacterium]
MKFELHSVSDNLELIEGFRTGLVQAKYYDPDSTNLDGDEIEITVIGCSSAYTANEKTAERVIVIKQAKVTICNQDDPT